MDALGEVNAREQHRDTKSLLFNPHTYDPSRRRHQKIAQGDHRLVRAPGQGNAAELPRVSGTQTSWNSSPGAFVREDGARRRARPTATATSAGTPAGSRRSARSWPSTAWTTGTPGRSPSSALGPVWQSDNASARRRAAQWLDDGAVFAFGLSEREHGADIYTTDMVLTPDGGGGFRATGGKYYIGNVARMVSVFGRRSDVDGPDGYVFFAADSQHENYRLVKNIIEHARCS